MTNDFEPLDDGEADVQPKDISDLAHREQVAFITKWFLTYFEDPQNEMPYADKESPYNYRYPWGGPYDASDEIRSAFEGQASDDAIDDAIEEMIAIAPFEWAPSSKHPERQRHVRDAMDDYRPEPEPPTLGTIQRRLSDGVLPKYGDEPEIRERQALRQEIAELREMLSKVSIAHGGIGHNNPPENLSLTVKIKLEITQTISTLDAELAETKPDIKEVVGATRLLMAGLAWMLRKADRLVDAAMTASGVALTAEIAGFPVVEKLSSVVRNLLEWMNTITLPF